MPKTRTYADLKAQIATLEAQAAEVRRKEISQVVADLKDKIAAYGLTAADLGFRGAALSAKVRAKATKVSVPRYRDPKTGATWTGHGRAPGWIANAKNRDSFLIAAAVKTSATAPAVPKARKTPKTAKAVGGRKAAGGATKAMKKASVRSVTKAAAKKPRAQKAVPVKRAAQPAQALPSVQEPAQA